MGYVEPNSEIRVMAATIRQMVNALVEQGFTNEEALDMTMKLVTAGLNPPKND